MSTTSAHVNPDHALKREFRLWSSFAFAFAFISPIVALYGIFGLAITTAGPSFWWAFPIVFGGQVIVALVFGTLVSRWPLEGSIYQWSRRHRQARRGALRDRLPGQLPGFADVGVAGHLGLFPRWCIGPARRHWRG